MADRSHLEQVVRGSEIWNKWRVEHGIEHPDLSGAELSMEAARGRHGRMNLLTQGFGGPLRDLSGMDLHGANLSGANLSGQSLRGTNLQGADLTEADLTDARFIDTNLKDAKLVGCRVHGVSVWNVDLAGAEQSNLFINRLNEATITVDHLDAAQLIYLMLNNPNIRSVLEALSAKAVLILGRFSEDRIEVLKAVQRALRAKGFLSILFDFEGPQNRSLTETVSAIAHLARFVIADLTDHSSVPQERAIVKCCV